MMRFVAFAAAAAYVCVSLPEGSRAADLQGQEVSLFPTVEHRADNEEQQQHREQDIQRTPPQPSPTRTPVVLGTSLLIALFWGLFFFVTRFPGFIFHKISDHDKHDVSEEPQTGGGGSGEKSGEGLAAGGRGPAGDAEESLGRPERGSMEYPPVQAPIVLGSQKVQTRITKMEEVLQRIKEGEESGRSVDSTGQSLGHHLRMASYFCSKNRNAKFDSSVSEEDMSRFKELMETIEKTLERHKGRSAE
ncbi:hypothetical protein, conserved [Eimeria praecox]|uniref:Transmembrane protein n=1 Tax=Eimeria praecox TaxID=51316 RepID=U6GYV8_9EIME|nr:hypothetical protein, conserved [Eimeria praecox]